MSECPVCQTQNLKTLPNRKMDWLGTSRLFNECQECTLLSLDPLPESHELEAFYSSGDYWRPSQTENRFSRAMGEAQARARFEFFSPSLPFRNIEMLDVGSGPGILGLEMSRRLGSAFAKYFAVEPDKTQWPLIRDGLRNFSASCEIVKDSKDIQGQFDFVALSHILEHLTNPTEFLNEMKKRMRQNGKLYAEVPFRDDLRKSDLSGHVLFFSPNSLKSLFEKVGLRVEKIEVFGVDPKHHVFRGIVELSFFKLRRLLPQSALRFGYSYAYGLSRKKPDGIWIRALISN